MDARVTPLRWRLFYPRTSRPAHHVCSCYAAVNAYGPGSDGLDAALFRVFGNPCVLGADLFRAFGSPCVLGADLSWAGGRPLCLYCYLDRANGSFMFVFVFYLLCVSVLNYLGASVFSP